MRIGIFSDTYPPYINGVSTSILMLKNSLEKMGHKVFVVTVNTEKMRYKYENDNTIVRVPGIPVGIYDYRLTGIYPFKAVNKIKKWNLDVIHSHTEFGVGSFARIIAKQLKIPIVHTYHTMYEDYVQYITKGYFDNTGKKLAEYFTMFYCNKMADQLIVPTKKAYDLFKEKYNAKIDTHIIPTGIETNRFHKENFSSKKINDLKFKLGISNDDFVILYLGRVASEKNVKFLLDCHYDLVKKQKNIKFLLVGDGPDLENLKKEVKKKKHEDSVIFVGKVPFDEVPLYYVISDLFATASTSETQGLTVVEAMAASVPPLCINDESFLTVVKDGYNGLIFNNKREYKKLVMEYYSDNETLVNLSNQSRISSDDFSSKYFGEKVYRVYEKAIGEKVIKDGLFKRLFSKFRRKK